MAMTRRNLIGLGMAGVAATLGAAFWAESFLQGFDRFGEQPLQLRDQGEAPEFIGIEGWLNSQPLSMAQLRGRVVLVDFWTFDCVNCLRTLSHISRWHSKYGDKGLSVVGVHSPETAFERNPANVEIAVKRFNVPYPVALDPQLAAWREFRVRYWPTLFLIDRAGRIILRHEGEGDYDAIEKLIQEALSQ